MNSNVPLYGASLALLTDLYQVTMAYGYWKQGVADREAIFHLFFRRHPFEGGFSVACGLAGVMDYIERFRFDESDLAWLAELSGPDGRPLFETGFLDNLRQLNFSCDVDVVPEGTVVFPHEPLVRVRGPVLQAQLLETALLNLVNFPTLIATKAARVALAAGDDSVLEFGLRRAQGPDGGLTASRAAYVGGCAATSNLLAGKLFGIPVRGTHAHSWVMFFDDEPAAFAAYAAALPSNCVFLVDTYDTLEGVRNAVQAGGHLRTQGQKLLGIRLDSGNLAELSISARRILDEAGFPDAQIVASSDLDEHAILELKRQGARIDVWGVGTRLATAYDCPALGGVYKLAAIREPGGGWRHRIKVSEEGIKSSTPGIQQVRRFQGGDGHFLADVIYDESMGIEDGGGWVDLADGRHSKLPAGLATCDLLTPVFRAGRPVYTAPPLPAIRARTLDQLGCLAAEYRRLDHPERYPVGLEGRLHELKSRLVAAARRNS